MQDVINEFVEEIIDEAEYEDDIEILTDYGY